MARKIESIEGLRAISLIGIMLYHMITRFQELYMPKAMEVSTYFQHLGEVFVSIFLIISAFFLYYRNDSNFNLKKFFIKKFFRLWPAYFISITLIYVVVSIFNLPNRTVTIYEYLMNIFFINGFLGIKYVDGAHWYLTTLISSIVIIGLIRSIRKSENIIYYGIWNIISISLAFLSDTISIGFIHKILAGLYMVSGGGFSCIITMGISLGMYIKSNEKRKSLILMIISLVCTLYTLNIWRFFGAILGLLLLYRCIMFEKHIILDNELLIFIGNFSYYIYLIHQNIGFVIQLEIMNKLESYSLLFIIPAMLIAILLGYLIGIIDKKIQLKIKDLDMLK